MVSGVQNCSALIFKVKQKMKIRLLHTGDEVTTILRNVWNYLPTDTKHPRRLESSESSNCQPFLCKKEKVISKGNIVPKWHSHKLSKTKLHLH
jgi:hypothetical protein